MSSVALRKKQLVIDIEASHAIYLLIVSIILYKKCM